jgi:hypothetical protein
MEERCAGTRNPLSSEDNQPFVNAPKSLTGVPTIQLARSHLPLALRDGPMLAMGQASGDRPGDDFRDHKSLASMPEKLSYLCDGLTPPDLSPRRLRKTARVSVACPAGRG